MNILYHHRTRGQGVEAVHIRGVTSALRALGHRVDVVAPPGVEVDGEEHEGAPASRSSRRGPRLWDAVARGMPEPVFEASEIAYNAWAFPALDARLATRPYGLIYDRYALFSVAGILAARLHDVPLILEVNDSAVVDRIRPLSWRTAARRVERFVWRSADAIVTVSNRFRDIIVEAGVPAERIHVMSNAVDSRSVRALVDDGGVRTRFGLQDKLVVGYAGALNSWRRVDLLFDAFAGTAARHPGVHLLLIGDGADRAVAEERARSGALAGRVTFTGRVPHAEVAAHLAALDIAVLPHSNDYGSPMKLFEYMAAGKPIVAPRLSPIVEILGDDLGVLFAPLDRAGLEEGIDHLLIDPARRADLGRRGRECVLANHVWERHAEAILTLGAGIQRRHPLPADT